ncbi:aminopeptidase [Dysgonomonas sp. 216]|uniref:aminopeptidase C n=1 Tax=Dysgonomonas sp. 216 TaxID=2302934 RepID=UPI0013D49D75|nr:C1 family peptidase [Dysgonomonas sp. 216]NDW18493.1 aminopeptidase [Dysgonomonas sp. 216]
MKKIIILSAALFFSVVSKGEDVNENVGYKFTVIKDNPITPVKNQSSSGTCWSFSAVGFLESEILRSGKGEFDLSEMYIVRRNYADKAQKYVRLGGFLNFAQGGSFADVIETIDEYGVLPDNEMKGLNYGETVHKHNELEAVLSGYLKGVIANTNKRLTTAWYAGFNGILDAYLGKIPESFIYEGKSYTPQSFAEWLGLKSDNYLSFTSFTHYPFYAKFAIEVPDNWRWSESYNLPLDEMMSVIDNAIENGYTVAWATDVSETGFSRQGIAVVPDEEAPENIGTDQAHWLGLRATEKVNKLKERVESGPVKEPVVTQEMRQTGYDNYETTDDHGMQIYGIAKDQNGAKYYMVKNSWGDTGNYSGIWYASEAFVRLKTISFVVNKNALPKDIEKKIGK